MRHIFLVILSASSVSHFHPPVFKNYFRFALPALVLAMPMNRLMLLAVEQNNQPQIFVQLRNCNILALTRPELHRASGRYKRPFT